MKASKIVLALAVLFLFSTIFSTSAFAAPVYNWPMPSNVKIVQKGTVDNIHTFNTITAALNSITDASATNPYLIKVMPGTYNEQVNMKSYVNVVGSGQDETVIFFAGFGATVYMATNSTLQSLKVVYDETIAGYEAIYSPEGGTIQDVATHADKGVAASGGTKIVNCNIFGTSDGVSGGPVEIFSSSISSNWYGIIAWGDIVVENSIITSTTSFIGVQISEYEWGGKFTARNSRISGSPAISSNGGEFKVANCQLIGGTNAVVGRDKIINCYDGNFNAIPNQ